MSYSYIDCLKNMQREYDKMVHDVSESEIKARNRVNISLEEYESMKSIIDGVEMIRYKLQNQIEKLIEIIRCFGVPIEVIDGIDSDSIVSYHADDYLSDKRRYRVEFEVDLRKIREGNL